MALKILRLVLAVQSLWIAPLAFSSPSQDDLNTRLARHVSNYNLGDLNFTEALVRVSTEFQIPMGVVWANTPATKARFTFSWKDATVREVIESIAKTQQGSSVEAGNGVVHVLGSVSVPEQENFLNLKLKSFEVHNQYCKMAELKLHDLITPPAYAGISIGTSEEPTITIGLTDTTVRGVLDALALASINKIWIVTFSDDTGLTPRGLRRTMSLWSGVTPPHKDQPVWDLLHWGDKLPPVLGAAKQE
jgi:hypothetical protein